MKKVIIKNNGFTLVELLAVIAIVAILVAMVMPKIMEQYNKTKINVFVTDAQTFMKSAKSKFMLESLNNNSKAQYYSSQENTYLNTKKIDIDSDNEYFIEMDRNGNFKRIVIYNENFCYDVSSNYGEASIGDLVGTKSVLIDEKLEFDKDMVDSKHLYLSGNDSVLASVKLENGEVVSYKVKGCEGVRKDEIVNNVPCQYNGELSQGAEYTYGSYTYKYKQEMNPDSNTWTNITEDGWGVVLTDKNSTSHVNDTVCHNINDKPIVSMSAMYKDSQAQSVNLSNINTVNVVNMRSMFENTKMEDINLTQFKVGKVTDMRNMFAYSNVKILNLSSFKTSIKPNVTDMFKGSALDEITLYSMFSVNSSIPDGTKIILIYNVINYYHVSFPAINGVQIPAINATQPE